MKNKFIVLTSIYQPSIALKKYITFDDWFIILVGDKKTPHENYLDLEKSNPSNFKYLTPDYQENTYKELSDLIGWNKIQRRNIGFIEALKMGAEIVASVDDDNIPLDNWGKEILIGNEIDVYFYEMNKDIKVFDPIGITSYHQLWHRGFPIQKVHNRNSSYKITIKKVKVDIQADFWNGDPDIDAICRLEHKPNCFFDDKFFPFSTDGYSPFNSQNTFFSKEAIKKYLVIPYIGRMDDIWASYYMESIGFKVIYNKPTVFQDRNIQNLTNNMKMEYIGYEKTEQLIDDICNDKSKFFEYLPELATKTIDLYHKLTKEL
jgi:hypothetical protein